MSVFEPEKQQVVHLCHTLLERGYLKATEGNISVRLKNGQGFAITPSNYDYAKMVTEDICVLDFELNRLEGHRKPSIESGMHAGVYLARPDVQVIIHTHQPYVSALALINTPIPALFDEQVRFLGRGVEIIPYAFSGSQELHEKVAAAVRNGNNAYILQNHGALVLGMDAERAIHNMVLLEKCAFTYLLALLSEKNITTIPAEAQEAAFARLRADQKQFEQNEKGEGVH